MRSRRDQDQLILQKLLALNLAASRRTFDKAQFDLLFLYGLDDVFRVATDQCRMNAGMLLAELAQKAGQHILSDSCGSAKGELARVLSAERGNVSFSLSEERANLLRISKKNTTGLCQGNVRPGAIEELNAKILFKCLYLKANCRLRKIQLLCSLP